MAGYGEAIAISQARSFSGLDLANGRNGKRKIQWRNISEVWAIGTAVEHKKRNLKWHAILGLNTWVDRYDIYKKNKKNRYRQEDDGFMSDLVEPEEINIQVEMLINYANPTYDLMASQKPIS